METIELKLLNPNDFKVLRVISFREKFTHAIGKICYFRPMTKDYQQGTSDEFDTILIEWLKAQRAFPGLRELEFKSRFTCTL